MIKTLKAGTLNDREAGGKSREPAHPQPPLYPKGLTLLELMVVIVILSSALLIIFPNISILEDFKFKSEVRRIAGLFRYLNESAFSNKIYYRVWFYPEKESFEIESSADGFEFIKEKDKLAGYTLNQGTDMQDIIVQGLGKINHGDVAVIFNPGIGAEAFSLHLEKNGRIFSISYNPYSGRVKIMDGYVEQYVF